MPLPVNRSGYSTGSGGFTGSAFQL
jgi:hypothetical protein